ncbi:MAG: sulfotransferase [Xanthomonadales bacterium]|nr:sulfotransferase [Xanthomonadales bacterium]
MNTEINKSIVYVAGLPRSGSTLMCQLLAQHPEIYSTGHSSPLANTLKRIRSGLTEDSFMLAQMDVEFDLAYQRIHNAMTGFVNGWFTETDLDVVVDKNRGWLGDLALLQTIDPNFKMVVCVRSPDQICGSIESRHRETALLDFPDGLANLTPFERADKLFSPKGVVGGPLKLIQDLQDIPAETQQHLYYVLFEDMLMRPLEVMTELFQWLGVADFRFNPQNLTVKPHESDSHYRFKYPHKTHQAIRPPKQHEISARIVQEIKTKYAWFYQLFYPGQAISKQ